MENNELFEQNKILNFKKQVIEEIKNSFDLSTIFRNAKE